MVTGEVLAFHYSWTYFRQVPTAGVVSASAAEHAVLAYIDEIRNYTDVRVTSSMLFLENKGRTMPNGSDFRLEWMVKGTFMQGFPFSALVYPLSGVPWALGDAQWLDVSGAIRSEVLNVPALASILCLSLAVAAVSLVLVRKHIPVVSISLEQAT
jgi:hypothetical protein